jgi:hypothetical protein
MAFQQVLELRQRMKNVSSFAMIEGSFIQVGLSSAKVDLTHISWHEVRHKRVLKKKSWYPKKRSQLVTFCEKKSTWKINSMLRGGCCG